MKRSLTVFAISALVCILSTACAPAAQSNDTATLAPAPTSAPASLPTDGGAVVNGSGYAARKPGEILNLKVGDTFEVRIPTIPTAGFTWQPQDLNPQMLLQLGDPVYEADTSPNSAGGIVVLKFKVVGAGTTPLTLIYANSAGSGGLSLYKQSFGITVNAK